MEFHQRARIKKMLHWLERERRAKGINLKSNQNPTKVGKKKDLSKIKCFNCHEICMLQRSTQKVWQKELRRRNM